MNLVSQAKNTDLGNRIRQPIQSISKLGRADEENQLRPLLEEKISDKKLVGYPTNCDRRSPSISGSRIWNVGGSSAQKGEVFTVHYEPGTCISRCVL
jgi:hypothetical protein